MLVDIPDDLLSDVVRGFRLREFIDPRYGVIADSIVRRRADLTPDVTAETLTEDAVGRLMVQTANVPDAEMRTRCILWLDYPNIRGTHGPSLAAEINRRAKDGRLG